MTVHSILQSIPSYYFIKAIAHPLTYNLDQFQRLQHILTLDFNHQASISDNSTPKPKETFQTQPFIHRYFNPRLFNHVLFNNISSVVEFQRWWVLKCKLFGQESTYHQGKIFKKFLRVMTVCQKVPKSYFQSQFWMSKINRFFSKKKII